MLLDAEAVPQLRQVRHKVVPIQSFKPSHQMVVVVEVA